MLAKLWDAVAFAARVYDQTPTESNLARLRAAELAYRLAVEGEWK